MIGAGPMGVALWHDEHLACLYRMCGVLMVHHHFPFEDRKEIIGIFVQMIGECALKFDPLDVIAIVIGHDMRICASFQPN